MSLPQIHQRIESILRFLQPYWELTNCHMVCYFTERHWERFVPERLQSEISDSSSAQECIESVFLKNSPKEDAINCKFPEFAKFATQCEGLRLEQFDDVVTSKEALQEILRRDDCKQHLSIKEFMTEKKRHEVEITAELVNNLVKSYKSTKGTSEVVIVDTGDGKGYLSSRLSLQYGYNVLGIDCNPSNTQNALERNKKLQRAWIGLKERAELLNKGLPVTRRGKKSKDNNVLISEHNFGSYNTISQFISPNLNISQLVKNSFGHSEDAAICLTGLHTCGNLAPACLELFHSQPECKILCNIGCCYHLLKEQFCDVGYFGTNGFGLSETSTVGFPLSTFLKKKSIKLGRNSRMLASQSLERTRAAKNPINISLYYRALLEILISENFADQRGKIQVGKVRKFNNFAEYVDLCCKQDKFEIFSQEKIAEVQKQYAHEKKLMELFYLFRMHFASILETLILLDRLLYLKEMGYENSFIVSVFDAVVSPRHFSLIAFKDGLSHES